MLLQQSYTLHLHALQHRYLHRRQVVSRAARIIYFVIDHAFIMHERVHACILKLHVPTHRSE